MKNKSQSGSALIQMVIAISFLGILTLTIGSIIKNTQDEQVIVIQKAAREELVENIKSILYAHPYCACTFQDVNIDPANIAGYVSADNNITELSIRSQNCINNFYTIARVGERIHGLHVNKITLRDLTQTGAVYNGNLVIESQRSTGGSNVLTYDQVPFQFTTILINNFLKIASCAPPEMNPARITPINAGSVYLNNNGGNGNTRYVFEELIGQGRQMVIAKLDLRWGQNFTVRVYEPDNLARPAQVLEISTGVDGHIRHDSSLIKLNVIDGAFAIGLDCRRGCMNIWDNGRGVDSRNRITPKAIIQLIE